MYGYASDTPLLCHGMCSATYLFGGALDVHAEDSQRGQARPLPLGLVGDNVTAVHVHLYLAGAAALGIVLGRRCLAQRVCMRGMGVQDIAHKQWCNSSSQ